MPFYNVSPIRVLKHPNQLRRAKDCWLGAKLALVLAHSLRTNSTLTELRYWRIFNCDIHGNVLNSTQCGVVSYQVYPSVISVMAERLPWQSA